MTHIPTPHIEAKAGEFAQTVLMPGDPQRAEMIAREYLSEVKKISGVRGIGAYTGEYAGQRVSVMASGMGIPSMGIYSYELYHFYDVESIIRVGSAGALAPQLKLRDLVAAIGACTNSAYGDQYDLPGQFAPCADYDLLTAAVKAAGQRNIPMQVGTVLSSDTFYSDNPGHDQWVQMGVLAVEMEAAGLYMNAARAQKRALTLCTISDIPVTGESCSAQERQETFTEMIEIALETALRLQITEE